MRVCYTAKVRCGGNLVNYDGDRSFLELVSEHVEVFVRVCDIGKAVYHGKWYVS